MLPQFVHPLPESWSPPELFQDSIVADGLELHRVGIAIRAPGGEEITASAVESQSPPVARSYFELLERISTLDAISSGGPIVQRTETGKVTGSQPSSALFAESHDPARWRFARSNGVAIHDSWETACDRAFLELAERDRILRCWYGETVATPIQIPPGTSLDRLESYETLAYSFPPVGSGEWSAGVHVVGVFGFPRAHGLPLVLGYAARRSLEDATLAAVRESLQALGFLWGEALPTDQPPLGPTPAAHVEAMLYPLQHRRIRAWLSAGHQRFADGVQSDFGSAEVSFFDLTPPWLDGLYVAKAVSRAAAPLAFGDSPFVQHLPADLRAHPIP